VHRRGELLGPWDRCRTHQRAFPDTFARWPSWRPMFDDQSSGRRGQRSAHGPMTRGGCGVCLTRRRGSVNSRRSSRSADLERRAGPPPGPAGDARGRRIPYGPRASGCPRSLEPLEVRFLLGIFACVYRFMSWTGPGKPLTARGGCYGTVMIVELSVAGGKSGRFAQCECTWVTSTGKCITCAWRETRASLRGGTFPPSGAMSLF